MGARKRNSAELRKEAKKNTYRAVLRIVLHHPENETGYGSHKGVEVNKALDILKFSLRQLPESLRDSCSVP